MAERLNTNRRPAGADRNTIRLWGLLCLVLGTVGYAVIQNGMLRNLSGQELLAAMQADSRIMGYATVAIVLNAINCCAAPLFAFLLVEGYTHTGSWLKYLLRMTGLAVVTEIPFNLAVGGSWLDMGTRNPVFALVLALVMLYFFGRYGKSGAGGFVVKVLVTVAGIVWTIMLGIQDGAPLVLLTVVLWAFRGKPVLRMIFGCLAAFACSLFSPYYIASPIVFIVLHFYNGEKGESNPWVEYASYPVILLVLGLVGKYMI